MSAIARRIVTICNKKGLHARAAAKFVTCAQDFEADIRVKRHQPPAQTELMDSEDAEVCARSILGLMMLGAGQGVVLELCAAGEDAEAALDALETLIAGRFEEDV